MTCHKFETDKLKYFKLSMYCEKILDCLVNALLNNETALSRFGAKNH